MYKRDLKTVLKDRELWFDGSIVVDEEQLISRMFSGKHCDFVIELTNAIQKFNLEHPDNKLSTKETCGDMDLSWSVRLPSNEEIIDLIYLKFEREVMKNKFSNCERQRRYQRIEDELSLFERIEKIQYLACLLYIIEQFKKNGIVWNGRGSSAASYVLYLIGAHRVDSVKYNIDPIEFFKIKT